uniref:Uncharacterized protein n=1 Tax=Anguilla anguilla TaxID=7936 RepID=A0A0E9UXY3_ANGAN
MVHTSFRGSLVLCFCTSVLLQIIPLKNCSN